MIDEMETAQNNLHKTQVGTVCITKCLIVVLMLLSFNARAQFVYSVIQVPDSAYNDRYFGAGIRMAIETARWVDENYKDRDTIRFDHNGKRIQKEVNTFVDSLTGETIVRDTSHGYIKEARYWVDTANHIHYSTHSTNYSNGRQCINYYKRHWDPLRHTDTSFSKVYEKWDSDSTAVRAGDWKIDYILDSTDTDCPVFYRYYTSGKVKSKCTTKHHGDTIVWTTLNYYSDSISLLTTVEREYPGRLEYRHYSKDGKLIESHDVYYGEDGLVMKCTDYKLKPPKRHGTSQEPWNSVTTYKYRYNRKRVWKECRQYEGGKLIHITKRKLRYY